MPQSRGIVGRCRELREFAEMLAQGHGVLGFYGLGGIGKTTLLRAMQAICDENQVCSIWLEGKCYAESLDLLASLIGQLCRTTQVESREVKALRAEYERRRAGLGTVDLMGAEIGVVRTGLFSKVDDITIHTEIDAGVTLSELKKNLVHWAVAALVNRIHADRMRVAFFFDSLESLSSHVRHDLEFIALSLAEVVPVACASRGFSPQLTSELLEELSRGDSYDLLLRLGVPEAFRTAILDFTGIPKCLELSARYSLLPCASPGVFSSYDPSTDDASLHTDYVRKLILDRLKNLEEYGKDGRIRGIADLLEYGCVLTELTPTLVAHTLGTTEPFDRYLSDKKFVKELLDDGLLRAHLVDATPPHFHDLIRSLALAALEKREIETYERINKKAAEYYARQLTKRDDISQSIKLLGGEFHLVLTTTHLHDESFAEWRQNFLRFHQHLSSADPQLGLQLVQQVFDSVFFAHYQPFCERILQGVDGTRLPSAERAWVLTKRAAAGLDDPRARLEDLLLCDPREIGQDVWVEAATRLMHTYLTKGEPERAEGILSKMERLGDTFIDGNVGAELYSHVASAYKKAARYKQALAAGRKAASLTDDDCFRAEMNLRVVIILRRLRDYAEAIALAERILPMWEKLGETEKLAETHIALGDVYRSDEKWLEARDAYLFAIKKLETSFLGRQEPETVREKGHRLSLLGTAYGALARYHIKARQLDRAERLLYDGLESVARGGYPYFHYGWMKRLLGIVSTLDGDYSKAVDLHEQAIQAAQRAGNYLPHQIENLICLLNLYSSLNDWARVEQVERKLDTLVQRTEVPLAQWEAEIRSDVSPLDEGKDRG